MNKNLKKIFTYIKCDYARYGKSPTLLNIVADIITSSNHSFSYCFWLRLASLPNAFYWIASIMHKRLSKIYGIQIYPTTDIGPGLCLGHGINIIVNPNAIIGRNCNLSHFTTIGSNDGKAAIIGNNVYIGPSVCMVEDVIIGDSAIIGAGAVVVKDVPKGATVAGVPATVVSYREPGRYIRNRCETFVDITNLENIYKNLNKDYL